MKKHQISKEESEEFLESVKNVKPLPSSRHHLSKKSHKQLLKKNPKEVTQHNFYETSIHPEITSEEIISFSRTGLQHKVLRQLKHGQILIQSTLDMHGLTSEQAGNVLLKFVEHCQQQHFRYVKIIHGKGRGTTSHPILKNKINNWLRQLPEVLAFHSAKAADGGAGALYVLLKLI